MLQIGCLGMLWLTNAAAVPTTPPGRGDRAVSVGRSLQIDSKLLGTLAVTLGRVPRSSGGGPKITKKSKKSEKTSKLFFACQGTESVGFY